jgi:SAM-dependent methyltransferase
MVMNKACDLEDFCDAEFLHTLHKIFGPLEKAGPNWPHGQEDRKFWEVTMAVLTVERYLSVDRRRQALGIGAGVEATSFILTNYFDWVFATDLYGASPWRGDAPSTMLIQPQLHAGSIPFRPGRLVCQIMDARRLRYEDETFDFIYSCSSIEHFGRTEDVAQAAREMGRVLRPGGLISISTEICIQGNAGRLNKDTLLFSPAQIGEFIVAPSGCAPVDQPDYCLSEATKAKRTNLHSATGQSGPFKSRMQDRWSHYPHIVIESPPLAWTSAQIALRKPG